MSSPYPPTPFGVPIGEVSLDRFTGEDQTGLLDIGNNALFVSPALDVAQSGNQIQLSSLEARVLTADPYIPPSVSTFRPFLVGPPPLVPPVNPPAFPPQFSASYFPTLNNPNFALMNTKPQIKGVLTNTSVMPNVVTNIIY
jgi:hypothetical protein